MRKPTKRKYHLLLPNQTTPCGLTAGFLRTTDKDQVTCVTCQRVTGWYPLTDAEARAAIRVNPDQLGLAFDMEAIRADRAK